MGGRGRSERRTKVVERVEIKPYLQEKIWTHNKGIGREPLHRCLPSRSMKKPSDHGMQIGGEPNNMQQRGMRWAQMGTLGAPLCQQKGRKLISAQRCAGGLCIQKQVGKYLRLIAFALGTIWSSSQGCWDDLGNSIVGPAGTRIDSIVPNKWQKNQTCEGHGLNI